MSVRNGSALAVASRTNDGGSDAEAQTGFISKAASATGWNGMIPIELLCQTKDILDGRTAASELRHPPKLYGPLTFFPGDGQSQIEVQESSSFGTRSGQFERDYGWNRVSQGPQSATRVVFSAIVVWIWRVCWLKFVGSGEVPFPLQFECGTMEPNYSIWWGHPLHLYEANQIRNDMS